MGLSWRLVATGLVVAVAVGSVLFQRKKEKQRRKTKRWDNWKRVTSIVEEFRDGCGTSVESLFKISESMLAEMKAGLAEEGGSRLKMLISFVENLPSGNETGLFYGLDLGGTNFRVLRVQLGGNEKRVLNREYKEASIPSKIMTSSNKELFGYIAKVLAEFVATEGEEWKLQPGQQRELGFTFSFPVSQESITSGTLLKWTKGFAIAETVGEDVVELLQKAMHRENLDMRVAALVNDTTGTLVGGRYWNKDVMVGIILGTGTNACYVERTDAIPKWPADLPKPETTVINMEWGNFNSPDVPRTSYDEELDEESVHPGEQTFEKLFSGMYLGDIVRRVLLKLAKDAAFFGGEVPKNMASAFVLRTPHVSKMHADKSSDLKEVAKVMSMVHGVRDLSLEARKVIQEVCEIAAARGARLVAAGIVGIVKKIGKPEQRIVVAMDGGLYEHYTRFRELLHEALVELMGKEAAANVVLELVNDGSGLGATLLAASHSRSL